MLTSRLHISSTQTSKHKTTRTLPTSPLNISDSLIFPPAKLPRLFSHRLETFFSTFINPFTDSIASVETVFGSNVFMQNMQVASRASIDQAKTQWRKRWLRTFERNESSPALTLYPLGSQPSSISTSQKNLYFAHVKFKTGGKYSKIKLNLPKVLSAHYN